jgi:hypothetical protein
MSAAVPVNSRRRDWFRIIRDLNAAKDSMGRPIDLGYIARKCGRSRGTVFGWADGAEPKESDARVVLSLYAKYLPDKYREHQKQFDIRVEIEAVKDGEQANGDLNGTSI